MRLDGQVAIVTGASGGIGGRIAAALAREGAAVIAHYGQDPEAADAVVRAIEASGGRARTVRGDLSRPDEAAAVVAAASATFGRLDILIHTAGTMHDVPILAMNDDEWEAVVAANLSGAFYCIRAALREFVRQRRGRIITITSSPGTAGQAGYVTAKAGLVGLTRAVAREVGSRGITVNAVAPGAIAAGEADGLSAEATDRAPGPIPLGRSGSADEVAATVVFLASHEAGYITGQVVNVDGGMIMY